jgi:hypothetical protein
VVGGLGKSRSSMLGSMPPIIPAGKSICIMLVGDLGAVASCTIETLFWFPASKYQLSSIIALKGRSVIGVIPDGSTEPLGGGGGSAATVSVALPLWFSLIAVI